MASSRWSEPAGSPPPPLAPLLAFRPPARSSSCARQDPVPWLPEATGGLVGARGGRDSAGPCSPVANGAASVSGASGGAGRALRAALAHIHSIGMLFAGVNCVHGCRYTIGTVPKWVCDRPLTCFWSVWSHLHHVLKSWRPCHLRH